MVSWDKKQFSRLTKATGSFLQRATDYGKYPDFLDFCTCSALVLESLLTLTWRLPIQLYTVSIKVEITYIILWRNRVMFTITVQLLIQIPCPFKYNTFYHIPGRINSLYKQSWKF